MRQWVLVGAALVSAALSSAPAGAEVKVALIGPITGQYAIFGDQMKRGAEYMVEQLNKSGGLAGEKVVLEVGDDACDPRQAVAVANQMAARGVAVVIGHYCSGSSIPASAVYNENGILQISPASTNPAFTDDAAKKGWNNVFRTCGRDDAQGIVAGDFIAERFKGKAIAVLDDKSAYGRGLAEETAKRLAAKGVKVAVRESYTAGEKDYSALVTKLKRAGIELVYVGGYHTEVGLMLRQAKDQGFEAQFMSGDANATDELGKIAGAAANGFLFTFGRDARKFPSAKAVVEDFRKGGFDPEGYTLYTVAAIQAYAAAVKEAKSTALEKVAAALRGKSFETVLGTIAFDEKGDVRNPQYVLYVYKDGKYSEL
ncbi:MAG: branched-chain amino acid ABC transporter substrate-binding protein [Rhodospirillales bacterium]|nr:branched-chain amino acid ABC transporter substrate-binding protein [Rhodospirillales bacterium]